MNRSLKVAVIGAGFAGLAMARELQIEGHQVTVFDRNDRVGGTWLYDPRVETDPLGLDPAREIVHSSAYQSLRTNLPRHIMGFLDYPFSKKEGGFGLRNFPGHEEVLSFLEDFARDFGLFGSIQLGKDVVRVEQVNGQSDGWVVEWKGRVNRSELELDREVFEAVVLCNGKHTEPKIADFPGMHIWPGMQIHSHNYRTAEPFQDLRVVIIGNASSAHDLCKEISSVAKEVHQACRTFEKLQNSQNICRHPMIERAYEDGKVQFLDGSFVYTDAIIHCTGYKYHFPFLKTDGMVTVDDNCVGPLYKHVFPPQLAPSLSFVGLPTRAIQSLVIELQAKWVAKVLSGKLMLPTQREMASSVEELYQHMEAIGWPKHHTHKLQQDKFEYENWLVSILGLSPLEKWREEMFFSMMEIISCYGEEYRDTWDVDKWIEEVEFNYFKRSS